MQRFARSPGDVAVIVVFAVLLLAPALLALTGHAGFDVAFLQNTEHRRPFVAPPPTSGALATGGWARDAERQIADAFPLRKQLIQGYDYAKFAWLGDVGTTMVIRGRDGWLFLGSDERVYLTDRANPSDAALAHVAGVYAARAAACARRGIPYVFLLAPNKSTIYPQYLPSTIVRVTPTAADRLLPLLRARGIRTVDVRAALIEASHHGLVYSKGDTHWNMAGAYIAYRAVVAALRDAGVREAFAPSTIRPNTIVGDGDLYNLAGVGESMRNEWLAYEFPARAKAIPVPPAGNDPALATFARHAYAVGDPALPTAVIFGDSFSNVLIPMLAQSFRRSLLLNHLGAVQFDERVVAAEHPTVVIQELVERGLVNGAQFQP
jgi:hypothetical protein